MAVTKTWDNSLMVDGERAKVTYEGLSTDSKPTTEVSVNDSFKELDTGDTFYYDGSSWVKGASSGGGGGGTSENQYDLTFVDTMDRGYSPRLAEGDFSKMPTLFYTEEATAYSIPLFYKSMPSYSIPADVLVYYDSDGQTVNLPEGTYDMMSSAMYDGEKIIAFLS